MTTDPLLDGLSEKELREEAQRRGGGEDDVVLEATPRGGHFATVTMAELLSSQGERTEAVRLCREILARVPGEPRALQLLQRLGENDAPTLDQPRLSPATTTVTLELVGGGSLFRWKVAPVMDRIAQTRAGDGARRVLRLVCLRSTSGSVAQASWDVDVEALQGEHDVKSDSRETFLLAAIGWLGREERFCSMAHSTAAWTSPLGQGSADK